MDGRAFARDLPGRLVRAGRLPAGAAGGAGAAAAGRQKRPRQKGLQLHHVVVVVVLVIVDDADGGRRFCSCRLRRRRQRRRRRQEPALDGAVGRIGKSLARSISSAVVVAIDRRATFLFCFHRLESLSNAANYGYPLINADSDRLCFSFLVAPPGVAVGVVDGAGRVGGRRNRSALGGAFDRRRPFDASLVGRRRDAAAAIGRCGVGGDDADRRPEPALAQARPLPVLGGVRFAAAAAIDAVGGAGRRRCRESQRGGESQGGGESSTDSLHFSK